MQKGNSSTSGKAIAKKPNDQTHSQTAAEILESQDKKRANAGKVKETTPPVTEDPATT